MSIVLTFHWQGLGRLGGPVRYRKSFDASAEADQFRLDVMEGRKAPKGQPKAPAEWTVRCDDGKLRRLGTADSCYTTELVERRQPAAPAVATSPLAYLCERSRRTA